MPVTLGRNLHFCFTKSKRPIPSQSSNIHENQEHHNMPFFNSLNEFTLECDIEESTIPDFSTVFASQRFFFSSPGNSNSITDSSFMSSSIPSTSSSLQAEVDSEFELTSPAFKAEHQGSETLLDGCTAIPTYSPNPYLDFRRSMQEIVESFNLSDTSANWDTLHELLMCYLALNPKSTHKYIVCAFADLLVSLMASKAASGDSEGVSGFKLDKFTL
ncbi:PREDICTED: transcription repressor OFP12-like [Nicotiana attenuata]|uniref:Transcription repressor n=1 Tax=Nicotiana attenuata TaxID=49451 RepID=A0A1J6JZS4_NICAT|nr:PREDICTED: transcription repressor OFP12-like [Nicotiana attenuata]OIT21940.1 transcription repressor ofp12 [Nicotiana attenuata]